MLGISTVLSKNSNTGFRNTILRIFLCRRTNSTIKFSNLQSILRKVAGKPWLETIYNGIPLGLWTENSFISRFRSKPRASKINRLKMLWPPMNFGIITSNKLISRLAEISYSKSQGQNGRNFSREKAFSITPCLA